MNNRSGKQRSGWCHLIAAASNGCRRPPATTSAVRARLGEGEDGLLVILLEADASVAVSNAGRQPFREHCQQVGAVHAVEFNLARQLGGHIATA